MPMATHTNEQIDYALNVFEDVGKELKILLRKEKISKKSANKYAVFPEDQQLE